MQTNSNISNTTSKEELKNTLEKLKPVVSGHYLLVANILGVDKETVTRWFNGRIPNTPRKITYSDFLQAAKEVYNDIVII